MIVFMEHLKIEFIQKNSEIIIGKNKIKYFSKKKKSMKLIGGNIM